MFPSLNSWTLSVYSIQVAPTWGNSVVWLTDRWVPSPCSSEYHLSLRLGSKQRRARLHLGQSPITNCVCVCVHVCMHTQLVSQSCLTLYDSMDYSPPSSSIHGILQARILEWVVISFSRGSSQLRDQIWVCCLTGRFFTSWATTEAPHHQ